MAITFEGVVRSLSPDEANLHDAARLMGTAAIPYLEKLVRGPDAMLASKAAYVAGLMTDHAAMTVLQFAAASPDKVIRVAAAIATRNMDGIDAGPVLKALLADVDGEVRQIAIQSMPTKATPEVLRALQKVAKTDPYPSIRNLSVEFLARSKRP